MLLNFFSKLFRSKSLLTKIFSSVFLMFSVLIVIFLLIIFLFGFFTSPSNDRNWNIDQKILPSVSIESNLVSISNIRNFHYESEDKFQPNYYDKVFDLNKIKSAWYIVEPFQGIPGSAHTFLSFEFEDENFVSISVEIRKEKGEKYHPIKGLLNKYELMYVIADENDVIKLRTNYRKDDVYIYEVNAGKEKIKELFIDMITRAEKLRKEPEFYNTLTNNCTTNIAKHVNKLLDAEHKISMFNIELYLPENSDLLAYKKGLIKLKTNEVIKVENNDINDGGIKNVVKNESENYNMTPEIFSLIRMEHKINDLAMKYSEDLDFSRKIRSR